MADIEIVQGDANFYLEFTIYDADGTVQDISSSTPTIKFQLYGGSTIALEVDGDLVGGGTTGQCQFEMGTISLDAGDYFAEIEINYDSGIILTVPDITVLITGQLPR